LQDIYDKELPTVPSVGLDMNYSRMRATVTIPDSEFDMRCIHHIFVEAGLGKQLYIERTPVKSKPESPATPVDAAVYATERVKAEPYESEHSQHTQALAFRNLCPNGDF
jgi:hypothetical protein